MVIPSVGDIVNGDAEQKRLAACREIAERMYLAGMGDHYDVIEQMTRSGIGGAMVAVRMQNQTPCGVFGVRILERTPYERGILDRYQDGYRKSRYRRTKS